MFEQRLVREYSLDPQIEAEKRPLSAPLRRALTLIELLVVIAIIGILAANLFPIFGRAQENERRSSCSSNMKQIGLGIMQYSQDYDESFPGGSFYYATHDASWAISVELYIKSLQVFACPSDPIGAQRTAGDLAFTHLMR